MEELQGFIAQVGESVERKAFSYTYHKSGLPTLLLVLMQDCLKCTPGAICGLWLDFERLSKCSSFNDTNFSLPGHRLYKQMQTAISHFGKNTTNKIKAYNCRCNIGSTELFCYYHLLVCLFLQIVTQIMEGFRDAFMCSAGFSWLVCDPSAGPTVRFVIFSYLTKIC